MAFRLWLAAVLLISGATAESVDMSNASLTNIPTTQARNLTTLLLSHNLITMSTSDTRVLQMYPKLRVLDLSYNLIQTLPSGAFDVFTNLEILNLRRNRLQSLPKDIFEGLTELKTLDLEGNPWDCSCSFVTLIKQLNDSGISIGRDVTCYRPEQLAGKTVFDGKSLCSPQTTTTKTSVETDAPVTPKSLLPSQTVSSIHGNSSNKEFTGDGISAGNNSWKFLLGVVIITLSTSMLIVCAVKSPSWYKLLFNYRHQRLREDAEPSVMNTGRYSNFSLDTQQTETSVQDLDESTEPVEDDDDDGFIEDVYIEQRDFREQTYDQDSLQ